MGRVINTQLNNLFVYFAAERLSIQSLSVSLVVCTPGCLRHLFLHLVVLLSMAEYVRGGGRRGSGLTL